MHRIRESLAWSLAACWVASATCAVTGAGATGTPYRLLTPPSAIEVGCEGPCSCPVVSVPTFGSFELEFTGSNPLYAYYDVVGYIASFNNGPGAVTVTGSGQYRIGGEVALQQQMTLDLSIEGRPPQHFDSGLVPVGAPFPQLSIACAANGFACLDSVVLVDAAPPVTGAFPAPPAAGVRAVWPNPFRALAHVTFALDRPAPVELTVIDLAGRRVRSLAAGTDFSAGPHAVDWDGRRDDGSLARAGVFWVVMRWPGGFDRRSFVRLD